MSGIFATEAPKYWARNIPAIPIIRQTKRPAIAGWQVFADRMPTEAEQELWLLMFGDCNIGVPNGPMSGVCVIDIDRDDPRVMAIVDRILPKSPWKRVGKKGAIFAYRYVDGQRTFKIAEYGLPKDQGGMILERLSKGSQFILPPSIHPDTGRPYVANLPLLDVIDNLPELPKEAEALLREALLDEGFKIDSTGSAKVSTFVPAGARDNAMVSHAGILSRAIIRGERSLLDALAEIKHWVETYPEQVAGDELDPERAKLKVIEFLHKDVTGEKRKTLPDGWDEGLTSEDKEKMGLEFGEDVERWTSDRLFEFLQEEFTRHVDPTSQGWTNAIDIVLDRIARNPGFSKLDEEKLLKFVSQQSKGMLTLTAMRKQLVRLRQGEVAGNDHTEIAKAVVKDLTEFGEIRFAMGQFYQWKGACWEVMRESELLKHIADEYGSLPAARRWSDHRAIVGVMRSECEKELVQSNVVGVNFANGFLTENLVLEQHHPDYGMTYVLPYRYLPENSRCDIFMEFLQSVWGEDPDYQDKILALQEAMASTLMGLAPTYQRAFCLIGQSGSGKSRITGLMRGLMPEGSHSQVAPSDWGDRFLPAQMAGKLINFAGEISETRNISGDLFKMIVEGQAITAQHKNQPPFQFVSKAAQWFASNHLPRTKDSSDGFNRRWLFLEFRKPVKAENMIRDLEQVFLAYEREQIVAWAMEGLPRLIENRDYTLPTSHMAMVDDMAMNNNSVRYFLVQSPRLKVGKKQHQNTSENRITGQRLFEEYWSFTAASGGAQRVQQSKFHAMMRELQTPFGFEQIRGTTATGGVEVTYEYITFVDKRAL